MLSRALVLAAFAVSLNAQAVISTRSGVVHYFEGKVFVDDQPLEQHLGRFANLAEGSELRTEKGRAEVLLTPGVILRIDEHSAIKMLAASLEETRVELLDGSAMIDSAQPQPGTSVTLAYQDWQVRFLEKGIYRVDSSPARVWVRQGEAEVADSSSGDPVRVDRGMELPLAAALVPEQSSDEPHDALNNWARGRADSISADNTIAANIQDPATLPDQDPLAALGVDPGGQNGFTQFPLLGLAPPIAPISPGPYGGVYSSLYPYQPGFSSLYLPGYTYMPLFLAMPVRVNPLGVRSAPIYSTIHPGTTVRPGITPITPLPGIGGTRVGPGSVVRPGGTIGSYPVSRPAPAVVRPAAPVAPVARPAAPAAIPRGAVPVHR